MPASDPSPIPRLCSVRYLNTTPLIWGLLHGPQRGIFDVTFALPSECADRRAAGEADIGIVPVASLAGQSWSILRGTGIGARGPVRSILLISRVPPSQIRTLAADVGSRTSVLLARIILARKYGAEPEVTVMPPRLDAMLASAEGALIIGDPALHLAPGALPYHVLDLAGEWTEMTGLPMVFAVWACPARYATPAHEKALIDSCRFGLDRIEEIIDRESRARGLAESLVRQYLTRHITFEMTNRDYEGMELFLSLGSRLEALAVTAV
ncbi:MAG: menaquinone biosynthetic enzyme MqnA/MqnD family protein [Bryobacteraceae bacterium]